MPLVSLVGIDAAGGTITGQVQSRVFEGGAPWSARGDSVAPHAPCPTVPSHCSAVTAQASAVVYVDGIPVVREGDAASCGHDATGASRVDVSG